MKEFQRSAESLPYQETFEVDEEWGVLIDGQIKITPFSHRERSGELPFSISAPGSISFLRESAGVRRPRAGFDRMKKRTHLRLGLAEGEKLWVGEGDTFENVFKVVDVINPDTSHLVCRYASPEKFTLEKVDGGDFNFRPFEISIGGRGKIFLSSSPEGALRSAERNYSYNDIDRASLREIEFSEGFRRVYIMQKRGVVVPFRLFEFFGLMALKDPNLEGDIGIPADFPQVTGKS